MSWIQVHDSSVTASAAGCAGQQLMKFWDSWTSHQERPVGTRMDLQQWKMQCGFLHTWICSLLRAGMAWLCWQTNKSSSLSKAVWEWYACIHAAPESSSVNRILRELLVHLRCCLYCFPVTAVETVPVSSAWKYNTNCPTQDLTKMVCNLKKQPKLKNLTQGQNCQSIHTEQRNRERDVEKVTTLYFY